jgi:hypothetical protein
MKKMLTKNLEYKFEIMFDRVQRADADFLETLKAIISFVKILLSKHVLKMIPSLYLYVLV